MYVHAKGFLQSPSTRLEPTWETCMHVCMYACMSCNLLQPDWSQPEKTGLYVCVCMCVNVCVYVCAYICMCFFTVFPHKMDWSQPAKPVCMFAFVCAYVCMYVCMHVLVTASFHQIGANQ